MYRLVKNLGLRYLYFRPKGILLGLCRDVYTLIYKGVKKDSQTPVNVPSPLSFVDLEKSQQVVFETLL